MTGLDETKAWEIIQTIDPNIKYTEQQTAESAMRTSESEQRTVESKARTTNIEQQTKAIQISIDKTIAEIGKLKFDTDAAELDAYMKRIKAIYMDENPGQTLDDATLYRYVMDGVVKAPKRIWDLINKKLNERANRRNR